jgi:carboxynorspermidine decarboxylase
MNKTDIKRLEKLKTPAYIVDERLLVRNLEILKRVQDESGCKILLALKGFSMYSVFPLIGKYLSGITSSSLFEAKLGREYMNKEVHIYSPAYIPDDFQEILHICDHIVFNSVNQFNKYKNKIDRNKIECGLRINPEYSEVKTAIYDPCAPFSRLGSTGTELNHEIIKEFDGLHFHTMCEQNFDTLYRTFNVFKEKFGKYFKDINWINLGGGHHITREDYDISGLIKLIKSIREEYNLDIYLEPGEAIALNTGFLISKVLDIVDSGKETAIIDTSAACHMPDVIEMPYRPHIIGSGKPDEKEYTYRLGGVTCLAGDIIGDYSFDKPLKSGDMIIFTDMAHYTMVKNNMFNGINLPAIYLMKDKNIELIRKFSYKDYKSRL